MTDAGPLTAMDIVVLLLVGGGIIFGVMRGFVTEVLSLLAWVAAVMALRLFYAPASVWAAKATGTASGGAVLAFAGLFFGAFILFKIIASQLGSRIRQSVVGPIDRVLGGGFGAVKGLIGASLLFLAANLFYDVVWGKDSTRPGWIEAGRTYPLLKLTSRLIVDFVEERRAGGKEGADTADEDGSNRQQTPGRHSGHKQKDDFEKQGSRGYTPKQRRDLDELLDAANSIGV